MVAINYFLLPLALAVGSIAQNVGISIPAPGATWQKGSNQTVQIDKANSLSGSTEVGIAIALQRCIGTPCEDVSDFLGVVSYAGPYTPEGANAAGIPFQNFTVTVPDFDATELVVTVVHLNLIGAGPEPFLQTLNVTVNLV